MLRPSTPDLKVYLHRAPIDMRAGRNGLAALAREVMQKDPFGNTFFLFTNKRYTALKILAWDINGFSLWSKVYVAAELMLRPVWEGADVASARLPGHNIYFTWTDAQAFSGTRLATDLCATVFPRVRWAHHNAPAHVPSSRDRLRHKHLLYPAKHAQATSGSYLYRLQLEVTRRHNCADYVSGDIVGTPTPAGRSSWGQDRKW